MKKNKKKPNRTLPLRNLLILTLGLFVVFAASDALLILSEASADKRAGEMEWAEDERVIYMGYEKTPLEDMLTSADLREHLKEIPGVENAAPAAYPLIDLPTTETYGEDPVNIVVFGDSFVWGEGSTDRNELFWRQLEQILRSKGYDCRVYAVGMAGATGYEELSWLTDTSLAGDLDPDIAVFGYVYNDALIEGQVYSEPGAIDYAEKFPILAPLRKLLPVTYLRLIQYLDAKTIYNKKYGNKYNGSYISVLEGETRRYYEENFAAKLDAFSRRTGIPAVVMTLPNETKSVLLKELYAPLGEIFAGTSVRYYDSLPEFGRRCAGAAHKPNIKVNPLNGHPGSASHRFYAEFLSERLIEDYADVLGDPAGRDLRSKTISVNDRMPGDIGLTEISVSDRSADYSFVYPDPARPHRYYSFDLTPYTLKYPIGEEYTRLSFATPVDLASVRAEGDGIEKLTLYFTRINPELGYDDRDIYLFRDRDGDVWSDHETQAVTSLCIHAEFAPGASRRVRLHIEA